MPMRWRFPPESRTPRSPTVVLYFCGSLLATKSCRLAIFCGVIDGMIVDIFDALANGKAGGDRVVGQIDLLW